MDELEEGRAAWRRRRGEVQVGWSDGDGLVLHDLDPAEVVALTALGTARRGRLDPAGLVGAARRAGVPRRRVGMIVETLQAHELVADRRPGPPVEHHVVVAGSGSLPWRTAALLRTAGVARVDLGHEAADDLEAALRADADPVGGAPVGTDPVGAGPARGLPDLVVLTAPRLVPARWGDAWRRHGVPVLPVALEPRRVVVGPLVLDPEGPCLHCLDLVRADLDGAWPALLAQADDGFDVAPAGRATPPTPPPLDPDDTLAALAACAVALLVRAHLEGRTPPTGVSVEASLPWPRLDHRRWPRHPDCAHHAHPVRATPHPRSAARRGRMTG